MKRILLFIFCVVSTPILLAQKMSVRGHVLDSTSNTLPYATVMLLSANDSSLVNFGTTDAEGSFEIKNVNRVDYILKITFVGYKTFSAAVTPQEGKDEVDLGRIQMEMALTKLDELVIQAERVPVVVKRDTIEFNATSFKTNPNATVEELLKKLPGVEVDNDGTIRAQGEEVRGVTVDGKTFFGSDPKVATRNLPADAIDKVQVYDKQSDQAQLTGFEDGNYEKTINLKLKKDKKKGVFGKVMAGAGDKERYEGRFNVNSFKGARQLSAIGMGNNTNAEGFSFMDIMNFTGALNQMRQGGSGGRRPDRTFLLDLPAEMAMERGQRHHRKGGAGPDRIDGEGLEFYDRVRRAYLGLAAAEPQRFRVIDSSGSADATWQAVQVHLRELFGELP